MGTYTTVQGDTWDQIAHRALGSEARTGELLAANRRLRAVLIFPAGVELVLPEGRETDRADISLPPWKR